MVSGDQVSFSPGSYNWNKMCRLSLYDVGIDVVRRQCLLRKKNQSVQEIKGITGI